jgi:2-haloacid dehalogenase
MPTVGPDEAAVDVEERSLEGVTAVVFDLGGVLVDWDREYLYRKLIPDADEREEFLTTICTMEWNHEMDEGRSVPEAVAELSAAHPDHAALIDAWWIRWPEMLGGEIPGTRSIAEALKRSGQPLYAITNWAFQTWPLGVESHPFLEELFEGIVVSGQEGIAKPDIELFEILRARYGLDPHTTIFIDDSPANIDSATELGYMTHLFTTADRLRVWLNQLGLLSAR